MKRTLLLLLICFCISGCNNIEPDHKYRQAVRDYLASKNHVIAEEIRWGTPDSVFSSFRIELARDYFVQRNWNLIDDLYFDLAFEKINSPQYKILRDSIEKLRAEIKEINAAVDRNIASGVKNRIGLEFEYILENGGHADFVFVFNEDGETVGHVQNAIGMVITLY